MRVSGPMTIAADPGRSADQTTGGRRMGRHRLLPLAFAVVAGACTRTLDAGYNRPSGLLPVDQRNPVILLNDGAYDNWFGEYAVLLANSGGSPLAGIIVNQNSVWPDIETNVGGYRGLVAAARSSGFTHLPDPISSIGLPLVEPASGKIEDTQPNRSEGALLIVASSKTLSVPDRPLVVASGGGLTDVADAYLIDPTVADRVVVVSSLGGATSTGGGMGGPNGQIDPWADFIVASRFRYVQVSAWYDQLNDVPTAALSQLPDNALGAWIAAKQPNLMQWEPAADQVAVLSVGLPSFATAIDHVSAAGSVVIGGDGGTGSGPNLTIDPSGADWIVTACDGTAPAVMLWNVLGAANRDHE